MNKILIALALTCGMSYAQEEGNKREPLIPNEIKSQVEAARTIHHTNIIAERDRFRAEMEKILAGYPKMLEKLKVRWAEEDKRMEERKEKREERKEERKEQK